MGAFDDLTQPEKPAQQGAFSDLLPAAAPISRTEKLLRGIRDPLDGAAQLFEHAMPQGFNDANHAVNNWLADKLPSIFAKVPERTLSTLVNGQKTGIDGLLQQQEAEYQARRAASGESGFDGYRVLGNVVSPVNLAVAAKLPQAATLAGRIGVGVLGGGGTSLLNPVTEGDDFATEKAKQVAMGAAFGGAVPAVTGAAARFISPKASINPDIQLLKSEGINPTIGQTLGGWANRAEERAQSIPFIGDAISSARQGPANELNRAAINRALDPIGEKLPMNVKTGNDAIAHARKALGDAYDNLLPRLVTQADATFGNELGNLKNMVQQSAMDPKYVNQFEKTLQQRVLDKFQGQNAMTGETLKDTQSFITNEIKRFAQSQDPDARLLSNAYKEVGDQLNALVQRSNPQYAQELKAINAGWSNFKRVQRAAGYLGAEDGVFSPAQLQSAVKAGDFSKDKARFAEGTALLQDLSATGKNVLSNKVPNSGTPERLLQLGAGAATYANPIPAAIGLLGGLGLYSQPAQSILRAAVSSRPKQAQTIAEILRKTAPALVPGGAQLGLGLLN